MESIPHYQQMEPKSIRQQLLADIINFQRTTSLTDWSFGLMATGDYKIIKRFKENKDICLRNVDKIYSFMNGYVKKD